MRAVIVIPAVVRAREQIRFTNTLDQFVDKKRILYNRRGNSKTTRIITAIKKKPKNKLHNI